MTNPTPHQPPPPPPSSDKIPPEGVDPDDAQIPNGQEGDLTTGDDDEQADDE